MMKIQYPPNLKTLARKLRKNMTPLEECLWKNLRRKQILGVQFYRQRPIGKYIVDFYAPKAKIIIEVDGSQHFEKAHQQKDHLRDQYFSDLDLLVLRFDNRQVSIDIESVLEKIYQVVEERIHKQ